MHWAILENLRDMAELLLKSGADIYIQDYRIHAIDGKTGRKIWQLGTTPGYGNYQPAMVSPDNTPYVASVDMKM